MVLGVLGAQHHELRDRLLQGEAERGAPEGRGSLEVVDVEHDGDAGVLEIGQVPDSQDSLYAFCSEVIGSMAIPIEMSLRRATSRSISSGMPYSRGSSSATCDRS